MTVVRSGRSRVTGRRPSSIKVSQDGTFKATQPELNFIGATVTNDETNDRVNISFNAVGGGSIGGTIASTQVAFGTSSNTIGGDNQFTFDSTNDALTVNGVRLAKVQGTVANSGLYLGNSAGNFTAFSTSRGRNIGIGTSVLSSLIDGSAVYESSHIVAIGYQAMLSATRACQMVAIGDSAAKNATTALNNVYVGAFVAQYGTTAYSNTGIGYNVFASASFNANENTAVGYTCMQNLTTGNRNVGLAGCLQALTSGNYNVQVGNEGYERLTTQSENTGVGHWVGVYTRGVGNTAMGAFAFSQTTTDLAGNNASYNCIFGNNAGRFLVQGDYNIWIGYDSGTAAVGEIYSNTAAIGKAAKVTTSNSFVLGGVIDANANNYGFGGESYASGSRVIFVKNAVTNPSGNPTNGFIIYSDAGVAKILNASGSAFIPFGNPMTTSGDTIYGGASGVATRLAAGSNGQVLTLTAGIPSWVTPSSGFADPMTTRGDIIFRDSTNTTARKALGSTGQYLSSDGVDLIWASGSGWALTGTSTLTGACTIVGTSTNTIKFTFNSLGTTQTDGAGAWYANTTAAAAGAQQISPSIVLEGQGWKTNATAASQSVKWKFDVLPVQGAANPTATLQFGHSINGAAYTNVLTVSSDSSGTGLVYTGSLIQLSATTPVLSFTGSGSQTIRFSGSQGNIQYNLTSVGAVTGGVIQLKNLNANATMTSGTHSEIGIGSGFAPTSGTCVYNMITATQTINQTGGANGVVTMFNISPTYTAAGGDVYGFRYNPTVTSITGVHYSFSASAGLMALNASVSGSASFRIPHGTAPSSPVDGDIWTTTAGIYVRINGSTVGPLS